MSILVPTWPKIQSSIDPRVYMRNGVRPSGPQVSSFVVGLLNHQLGHRMRRHFSKTITAAEGVEGATTSSTTTWRWLMRTLPNETEMKVRLLMVPGATGVNDHPYVYVKITKDATSAVIYDDGTSGTDKRMWHGPRSAAPTTPVLDDYAERSASYALEADTVYRCEVVQGERARIVALTAYGMVRSHMDPALDVCVDPGRFLVNQPITETQNGDVLDSLQYLWKRHGAAIAYSVPGTTAKTVTGTTETNILDATTTWTSSTKGFRWPGLNTHSLDETLGGSPLYLAPVHYWCYASVSGGGTAAVRFRWDTSGVYGAVTGISSGTAAFVQGAAAQGVVASADQKIDITAVCSTAGTTVSVYAAGMYSYVA